MPSRPRVSEQPPPVPVRSASSSTLTVPPLPQRSHVNGNTPPIPPRPSPSMNRDHLVTDRLNPGKHDARNLHRRRIDIKTNMFITSSIMYSKEQESLHGI
jgi:hypothetical protein